MAETKTLMTADELFSLPDDGYRYELVRGELIRMTPAGGRHGRIAIKVAMLVGAFVEDNALGETFATDTGFKLTTNPDTVRAPDFSFVSAARIPATGIPENFIPLAPDLAVEVTSPGDTYNDILEKAKDYLEAGSRLIWVVNPKSRTVTVFRSLQDVRVLTENDTVSGEDVLPGFSCAVREFFS